MRGVSELNFLHLKPERVGNRDVVHRLVGRKAKQLVQKEGGAFHA